MSFINEYLIEINEWPVFADGNYTVKDYFYYDSNIKKYDNRNLLIPASKVLNSTDLPSVELMKKLINNNVPIMNRITDTKDKTETWVFNIESLEEI